MTGKDRPSTRPAATQPAAEAAAAAGDGAAPPQGQAPSGLRDLRRWHLGSLAIGSLPATAGAALPADALPALLAPFRDATRVRHDFPLALLHDEGGLQARPLGELLPQWTARATAQARVLQDNLLRLERRVRLLLAQAPLAAADAKEVLGTAATQMLAELQLRDTVAAEVRADLDAVLGGLPAMQLLSLSATTPLRLLMAAAERRATTARTAFTARVATAAETLRAQLQVEADKDPDARSASALSKSLGGAGARFFDPAALAKAVGQHRGSRRADPERRQRLQQALATLEAHLAAPPLPEMVVVHTDPAPDLPGVTRCSADDVCAAAARQFDDFVVPLLATLRAVQVAELEQHGGYEPERHDALLAGLTWSDLSADDLHLLPVVVAVAPAAALASYDMQTLTRLLVSGRPVQVIAMQVPAGDPAQPEQASDVAPPHARLELGYLGIAFRDAYVQQSTAARPAHLLRGFERALAGTRPGLHVVDSGLDADGHEPILGAFLHAGAAIEGRAHPLFQYDPEAGDTFARRLDFTGNPAPKVDWPSSALRAGEGGTPQALPFTFADYALLQPRLHDAFALLPDALQSPDLLPLAAYLELPAEGARRCVPFVTVAGGDGALRRVAVRRTLVRVCRDRLRFWRTLQELAGVRNDYVREAVQRARQEGAEQAAREREALLAQQREELQRERDTAAAEAMQALARMLLELDPLADAPPLPSRPKAAAPVAAPTAPAVAAAPATPAADATASASATPPAAPAEAGDDEGDDPWIESARCSTCNDCVNLNPLLFVYDANKQARIGDARKGTYAQLVLAAEKCPSRCIHPGKPLDPNEPDLEALMARAAPFNR